MKTKTLNKSKKSAWKAKRNAAGFALFRLLRRLDLDPVHREFIRIASGWQIKSIDMI